MSKPSTCSAHLVDGAVEDGGHPEAGHLLLADGVQGVPGGGQLVDEEAVRGQRQAAGDAQGAGQRQQLHAVLVRGARRLLGRAGQGRALAGH